ncbi:DUF554 domain-containing protein [Calidifontibacillus oryziterrae]|uniref:DUF554 domain-containing protein n=1 Tax=Calidifontibacillus oryziterrae TaxID=1191699 RepID=UPI0002E506BA|nr:DUF554 domain-containing protein [Calidifontibacillus oryziterrae]
MVLLGTIVNGIAIIFGTFFGKFLHRIPEKIKTLVLQSIGLAVVILGIQMGFKSEQYLIVILSLLFGSIIGEVIDLDRKLNALGRWIEVKMGAKEEGGIAKGFVTATLIFAIGAMAIIGALDSGLRNDHSVLFTKSLLDGFTSLVLATTLGIGVLFSAFPVMIYQGAIALFATQIDKWIPQPIMDSFIVEMTATGGIMILAIGLNMLEITRVRVANMLPAILVVAIIVTAQYFWTILF